MNYHPWSVSVYERELVITSNWKGEKKEKQEKNPVTLETREGAVWIQPDMFVQNGGAVKMDWQHIELGIHEKKPEESHSDPFIQEPPTRKTGDIQYFSKKSRMRLFRKFNRCNLKLLSTPIFVTLTARQHESSPQEFQYNFRKKFLPLLRKAIPQCVYLWRLEPHRSGKPHYHLLVFSAKKDLNIGSEYYLRRIRKAWRIATGDDSRAAQLYSCKTKVMKDLAGLTRYLSKYIAKEDDDRSRLIRGRRWGVSRNFPTYIITSFSITEKEHEQLKKLAREFMKEANREKIWEKIELFADWGWSLFIPMEKSSELFEQFGIYMLHNAMELYKPPPNNTFFWHHE